MFDSLPALSELFSLLKAHGYSRVAGLPAPYPSQGLAPRLKSLLFPRDRETHRLFTPSPRWRAEYRAFARREPNLFLLFRAFMLNEPVSSRELARCLGASSVEALFRAGCLRKEESGSLRATIRVIPYRDKLLATDPMDRSIPNFIYMGVDSIQLAEFLDAHLGPRRFAHGLDIGTGSGIQALVSANRCGEVIAIDINPRALKYAGLNAALNGIANLKTEQVDFKNGLTGPFDLIVSNPPFRLLPDNERVSNRDGFGGELGIELTLQIVGRLPQLLQKGGEAILLTAAPVIAGRNVLAERLSALGREAPCQIEMRVFDVGYPFFYHELLRRHGITKLLACFLVIMKAETFHLTVEERIPHRRIKELAIRARRRWRG